MTVCAGPAAAWRALLGDRARVVGPRPVPEAFGKGDPGAALAAAGGPPGDGELLVLVNDPDRATRTGDALEALRAADPAREMRVLVATGTHRHAPERRAAHERMLRSATGSDRVSIAWHDAETDAHERVGALHLDRRVAAARAVVAIGSVEPHWFAGLTGAHKTLTVGVMAHGDIRANHAHALTPEPRPLRLAGNPLHEELAAAAGALAATRDVLALQHVGDRWIAGDPVALLDDALAAARASYGAPLDAPAAALVACVLPPLDRSLYQAEKGLKLSEHAVADGGAIVLDAACPDGVGPRRFVDLLERAADERSARAEIDAQGYRLGDHKAVRWRALQSRGVRIGLVAPRFPAEAARAAGLTVLPDRPAAAVWLGRNAPIVIVDDAAHVVPSVGTPEWVA